MALPLTQERVVSEQKPSGVAVSWFSVNWNREGKA